MEETASALMPRRSGSASTSRGRARPSAPGNSSVGTTKSPASTTERRKSTRTRPTKFEDLSDYDQQGRIVATFNHVDLLILPRKTLIRILKRVESLDRDVANDLLDKTGSINSGEDLVYRFRPTAVRTSGSRASNMTRRSSRSPTTSESATWSTPSTCRRMTPSISSSRSRNELPPC